MISLFSDEEGWPESNYRSSGGISLIRLPWEGILWFIRNFIWPLAVAQRRDSIKGGSTSSTGAPHGDRQISNSDTQREMSTYLDEEDEEESIPDESKKKMMQNDAKKTNAAKKNQRASRYFILGMCWNRRCKDVQIWKFEILYFWHAFPIYFVYRKGKFLGV